MLNGSCAGESCRSQKSKSMWLQKCGVLQMEGTFCAILSRTVRYLRCVGRDGWYEGTYGVRSSFISTGGVRGPATPPGRNLEGPGDMGQWGTLSLCGMEVDEFEWAEVRDRHPQSHQIEKQI